MEMEWPYEGGCLSLGAHRVLAVWDEELEPRVDNPGVSAITYHRPSMTTRRCDDCQQPAVYHWVYGLSGRRSGVQARIRRLDVP